MTATTTRAQSRTPLLALLTANYVSWFGNGLTIVAVPLFVLSTTGSSLATGLAGFANAIPLAVGGLAGGVVVDRLGGRLVSVVGDLLAGVLILLVPLLHQVSALPFAALLVLLAARTLVDAPGSTARLALLEPLTQRAGMRPEGVNAAFSGAQRIGLVGGPPVAALLAQVTDPALVLYIDAATFLVSALLVAGFVPRVAVPAQAEGASLLADLRAGLAVIARTPILRAIITVVVVTNFIDDALSPVVLPVFSRDVLGRAAWVGLLVALFGVGTAAGTFLYGPLSRTLLSNRFATFVGAFACIALMRAVLALRPDVVGAAVVLFLLGLAAGPLNPLITTVLQESTEPSVQGRVFGVLLALAFVAAPFGILVQAWLISATGITTALWVFAGLYAMVLAGAFASRGLRSMSQPGRESP
jgi:MFS family permease